jgi:hypothetical protein
LLAPAPAHGAQGTDLILHATELHDNGRIAEETWTDRTGLRARTINYDTQGKIVGQSAVSVRGSRIRTDTVVYPAKRWITRTASIPPTAHGLQIRHSAYFPAEVRKLVSTRRVGLVGTQAVAGRKTLKLQGQAGPQVLQIWVEPKTYLAVQLVVRWNGRGIIEKLAFDWLPRTPTNQAKLKLVVPPGFQHLD